MWIRQCHLNSELALQAAGAPLPQGGPPYTNSQSDVPAMYKSQLLLTPTPPHHTNQGVAQLKVSLYMLPHLHHSLPM
jgi:hypothetical protein